MVAGLLGKKLEYFCLSKPQQQKSTVNCPGVSVLIRQSDISLGKMDRSFLNEIKRGEVKSVK